MSGSWLGMVCREGSVAAWSNHVWPQRWTRSMRRSPTPGIGVACGVLGAPGSFPPYFSDDARSAVAAFSPG